MSNPYQKPKYLTETEKTNCFATNRGWVILKPHGKYDIVESIADLDNKIKNWHEVNDVEFSPDLVKEEHQIAFSKVNKSVVSETYAKLEEVKAELKVIDAKIEEIIPVLQDEVQKDEIKIEKPVAIEKSNKVKKEKQEKKVFVLEVKDEISTEQLEEIKKNFDESDSSVEQTLNKDRE